MAGGHCGRDSQARSFAPFRKDCNIVISNFPAKTKLIFVERRANFNPTWSMIAGETLEYSDQTFKGECPPGMDRAKKNQIVINVEGSMVIRSDVKCRVYLLQVADILYTVISECHSSALIVPTEESPKLAGTEPNQDGVWVSWMTLRICSRTSCMLYPQRCSAAAERGFFLCCKILQHLKCWPINEVPHPLNEGLCIACLIKSGVLGRYTTQHLANKS